MTEPVPETTIDLAAWLRALPLGTILLASDQTRRAWQVRTGHQYLHRAPTREFTALMLVGSEETYELAQDEDVGYLVAEAPWTVVWMPPVGVEAAA